MLDCREHFFVDFSVVSFLFPGKCCFFCSIVFLGEGLGLGGGPNISCSGSISSSDSKSVLANGTICCVCFFCNKISFFLKMLLVENRKFSSITFFLMRVEVSA